MGAMEVWIEYASTYSYLTVSRIGRLARERGVHLDWQPFGLGPVRHQQQLGFPFPEGNAKTAYMWRDLERRAAKMGLPYRRPSMYPVKSLPTARIALLGAAEGWCQAFTEEVFRLHWTEDCLIGTEENLQRACARIDRDPALLVARADGPDGKAAMEAQTTRAVQRGIFGAPSFVIGSELFWGDDRLEDALDCAAEQAA